MQTKDVHLIHSVVNKLAACNPVLTNKKLASPILPGNKTFLCLVLLLEEAVRNPLTESVEFLQKESLFSWQLGQQPQAYQSR